MPKPVFSPSLKYIAFFIAILLALLAILGVGITYAYRGKFYPGVKVGGVSVGGQTQSQATAKLAALDQAIAARPVTIALPDITQRDPNTGQYSEQGIATTAGDLGLAVDSTAALNQAWAVGHRNAPWQWVKEVVHLFYVGGQSFATTPTLDGGKVREFVATQVVAKASPPQPAKVVVDGKNVTIQDEIPGLAVDGDGLSSQLSAALVSSLDGDALSFRIPPVLTDSPIGRTVIQPIADQLNTLGDTKVSLAAEGIKLVPARDEILQWYTPVLSDTGDVSLGVNSDRISSYIQKKGSLLDLKKSLAVVNKAATDWLATPAHTVQLAVVPKPPKVVTVGSFQAGLFEGKYIYVNLAEQKLYRVDGQNLEKVYRVSTGKWSTPTPRGTFHVGIKVPRAYSRPYGLYMPWWQNLLGKTDAGDDLPAGSYGLHELPEWPNGYKEGQGHLGTAVSHGCVRLGVGDAKELYDWTENGTPVVIE